MLILIPILFLATAYAATSPHSCIHSNKEQLTADVVIGQLLKNMDANNDQTITTVELIDEFLGKFDSNDDSLILRGEFVPKWHEMYRDVPDFADYLFDHFDRNNDDMLSLVDIPVLKSIVDLDDDKRTSDVEFTIFMTHLYQDCVPHTHKPPSK